MMESDSARWLRVAVEPCWNDLEHRCFKGQTNLHGHRNSQYKTMLELLPDLRAGLHHTSLFIVFSVSNSNMNSTANQSSCRLPSASLMKLFLPALLFFVLGTGTSAMPALTSPVNIPITYEADMSSGRGRGYWQPKVRFFSCHVV